MAIVRDEAVVLRRFEFSETSQVIVCFTRDHGKVRLLAKGVKRSTRTRFAPAVDLLDVGGIAFTDAVRRGKSLAQMTEFKQARALGGLRERYERIVAGQYLAEITDLLTEDNDTHAAVYDGLVGALSALADEAEVWRVVVEYQRLLLRAAGLVPRLDACMLCGRTTDLTTFCATEGGTVCRHCEMAQVEKMRVTRRVLAYLRAGHGPVRNGGTATPTSAPTPRTPAARAPRVPAASTTADDPAAPTVRGAFELLDYHICHALGKAPKVTHLLRRI